MPSQDSDTIALFGPQIMSWTRESLLSLQHTLLLDPHLSFLKHVLVELPSLWPTLATQFDLANFPGHESLLQLGDFAAGNKDLDDKSLHNILLAPLTIVDHMVQFIQMAEKLVDLEVNGTDEGLKLPTFRAAQGFCIGFLSAAAISSSSSWAEFELNASNALRIAACIGAVVDNEDASHSGSTSISVRWQTDSDRTYVGSSLDLYPDVSSEGSGQSS